MLWSLLLTYKSELESNKISSPSAIWQSAIEHVLLKIEGIDECFIIIQVIINMTLNVDKKVM